MNQIQALEYIVNQLHSKYPNASIGVSGSVATNAYNIDSDVDLLFQQKDIKQSSLLSFSHEGIKISLFSFNKELLYQNERKYLFTYHNMPMTYISSTKVLYDDNGIISDLKRFVEDIVNRRVLLKSFFISELKMEIDYCLQMDLHNTASEKRAFYSIVNKIISIFYLKFYANKIISKKEGNNPFNTILNEDNILYEKIKKCLPYGPDSYKQIKWVFENYILTNY